MWADLPEQELRSYRGAENEPDDFDTFWASTLASGGAGPIGVEYQQVEVGLVLVDTFDVSYAGWNGDRIHAWLTIPQDSEAELLPTIVEYVGYGGGRGAARDHLLWAAAGYAHLGRVL